MKLLLITQKVNKDDQLLGFFISWLEKLSKKFEKITVLCLEKGEYDLPSNVEVISLGKERGYSKVHQLSTFYSQLTTLKYDSVFVHMNPIWVVLGGPIWKLMRRKIFFWYTSGGVTAKLKLAEKFSDVIFTASKESFRLPSRKVIITGHGIDTGIFIPTNNKQQTANNKFKILSVGRISPVKNYETLLGAAKILKDRGFDFTVTMAGEASPLKRDQYYVLSIKDKIKKFNLENNFNLIGKVNHQDLPACYQLHDLFIHLSRTGSLDKALLEAMACGIKILSSSDSARVFLPAELIFRESDPQELSDKISAMKNKSADPALREYVVKNHNLDVLIEKIASIINR